MASSGISQCLHLQYAELMSSVLALAVREPDELSPRSARFFFEKKNSPFPLPHMADSDDIKKANEDLSRLLRASIFPGAVSSFPKRSVTQEMLAQAEPDNPEYK